MSTIIEFFCFELVFGFTNLKLINEIIATVISGLILTLLLFIINEFILPQKNLTGEWLATVVINETSYNPFRKLKLQFKIHLLQMGNQILGSGEKIKEIYIDGSEKIYKRKKRVKIEISGNYDKKYLRRCKVYFNIIEYGRKRESRSTYFLKVYDSKLLKGSFNSTAADSKGTIEMKRFDTHN